jgi:hypothetical protein
MCSTIRTLNNEARNDTQEFINLWENLHLHTNPKYELLKKIQATKIEPAEMNFLRRAAGYTMKDQIRNTKIMEELKFFNLNNKILKSRSQWKFHV